MTARLGYDDRLAMPRLRRFVLLTLVAAVPWLAAPPARAQSASDKAAAEALFREGRKLFDAGQFPAACAKLAESQRLDPAPGTLLNLAGCYEKNGQTASAWATFKEAGAASHQKGRTDWEELARTRAAALEPGLSHLTIRVSAATPPAGLVVKRDGEAVGAAVWGTAIPVDPGPHTVDAEAPDHAPFHQTIEVDKGGAAATVVVPELAAATDHGAGHPGDPQGESSNAGATQRTVGVVVAGAGLVGLGIGAAFGLVAINKQNDALKNDCTADRYCNAQGLELSRSAHDAATAANIAFGVGAAALAGGIVVYLLAPRHAEATPTGPTGATGAARAAGAAGAKDAAGPTVGLSATPTRGGASLGLVGTW